MRTSTLGEACPSASSSDATRGAGPQKYVSSSTYSVTATAKIANLFCLPYNDPGAVLDDLREAVTMLEDAVSYTHLTLPTKA